jgi:hypothetical protein
MAVPPCEPSALTPQTGDLRGHALEIGPILARTDFSSGDLAVTRAGPQSKTLLVQGTGSDADVTLTGRRCDGDGVLRFEYSTAQAAQPVDALRLELKPRVTTLGDPSWPGYFVYPTAGRYLLEVSRDGKVLARAVIEAR